MIQHFLSPWIRIGFRIRIQTTPESGSRRPLDPEKFPSYLTVRFNHKQKAKLLGFKKIVSNCLHSNCLASNCLHSKFFLQYSMLL